jgi:hypothetical protein
MIQWPKLEICPHPRAIRYARESNPQLVLQQVIDEISSGRFSTSSDELRALIAETGLVSLWFYEKFILGAAGPYSLLDTGLHVDMCNYRQRLITPGSKGAILVPRSAYKSTICSHGGNSWELVRDPDLAIGCTSEIYDRALSFVQQTIANFEENEFHKWLYPEWKKENRSGDELILANRTRRRVEPSLKAITAGGSTQGIHVDVFNADDIVGETMLNAERSAGADMYKMVNWLHGNLHTLVVSQKQSRVIVVGTRYSVDDPYEPIMQHSFEHYGYWEEVDYPLDPDGDWQTYYRPAIQGDESILPDSFTKESLQRLMETNPWLVQTQYMNNPKAAGASDFAAYEVGNASMDWVEELEDYVLTIDGVKYPLSECDIVAAGDPSGGGKQRGLKSSKAAACVIARTHNDRRVIIEAHVGYVEPTKFFTWLEGYQKKYKLKLRCTYVEAVAGFKAMVKLAREECGRRGIRAPIGIPALGDKETTIRNIFQPLLDRNLLYTVPSTRGAVMAELRIFPSPRMDLLDALKIALHKSHRPGSPDGDDSGEDDEDGLSPRKRATFANTRSRAGY